MQYSSAATRAILVGTLAVLAVALLFLWPVRAASPRDLPIVVAGPPAAAQLVEQRLAGANAPFVTTAVADRAAAVRRIETREAYGGIVLTPGTGAPAGTVDVELLTATAASPAVAQALVQGVGTLGASGAPGPTLRVHHTELAPLAEQDPRGAGIAMLALPLGIGGLIVGVLTALQVTGRRAKVVTILAASTLAGLGWTLVLHPWFGLLTGSMWTEWALAALAVAAIASSAAGAHALLGVPGLGLIALITTPFGFPLAGTQLPPEFLPSPWGAIGQGLVPGAAATALRTESYFPAASLTPAVLVMALWLAAGLALSALSRPHRARTAVEGEVSNTPPSTRSEPAAAG
ncbi:MAG: hypothetical protein M9891_09845 [Austwickia sp.]|nr:hypothetical protein [Austwickia sp.]